MLDRERILAKVDELGSYLRELREIAPRSFTEYQRTEIKRACERLLQIAAECVVDLCHLFVSGLRLGLPAEEDDLFEKLAAAGVFSPEMRETVRKIKGFRNILVHEYARIDDLLVYEAATQKLSDFEAFKREMIQALDRLVRREG